MQVNGIGSGEDYTSLQQMMEAMKARMFKKLDADSSGGIDETELKKEAEHIGKDASALIEQYDENGDGVLNADEMDTMLRENRPPMPPPPPPAESDQTNSDTLNLDRLLEEVLDALESSQNITASERAEMKEKLQEYIQNLSVAYGTDQAAGALVDLSA